MALIKIKQIDGLSSELSGLSTDIVAAESTAIVVAGSLDTVLETSLSADIVAAESDAIVAAGSLDTVLEGELQTYAGSLDTVLETSLSSDIVAAESTAIATAGSLDTVLEGELQTYAGSLDTVLEGELQTYAGSLDTVLEGELQTYAGSLDTVLETALSADIVAAESTAISHANSLDVVMDGRVDTLEAAIIEDDEFFVETFAGTPVLGPYTLANSVQDNEVELVWAYVNGVSVEVATVSGTQVTLATPGYAIDANDTVKFHYQSA